MSVEMNFDGVPGGYVLEDCAAGEQAKVGFCEFVSSEDGSKFIKYLEGWPSQALNKVPANLRPQESQIDNLLLIFRQDKSAILYLNEVIPRLLVRANRSIKAGESIFHDDVIDVARLKFQDGIEIPEDCGFFYLFSIGWRKGLYYDVGPLHGESRSYDVSRMLASVHTYLSFFHLFQASEAEWQSLLNNSWFPFRSLSRPTVETMFWHARNNRNYEQLTEVVSVDFEKKLQRCLAYWRNNQYGGPHIAFLEKAVAHYQQSDYISACGLLYPQMEGLMRSFYSAQGLNGKRSQVELIDALVIPHQKSSHSLSILLPEQFCRFLETVQFRGFDPINPVGVSRHTISHGVVNASELDKKAALVALLTIDQLFYYMHMETE